MNFYHLKTLRPAGDFKNGWIDVNEQEQAEAADFFNDKKNKRNFYIGKNTKNWKYDFDEKNDILQKFEDGTPKLKIKNCS